jgi:hypothetical protein
MIHKGGQPTHFCYSCHNFPNFHGGILGSITESVEDSGGGRPTDRLHVALRDVQLSTFGGRDNASYPSIGNAMEESGLASVNQYITRRRDGIVDSVMYRLLYTVCCNATISEWLMGSHTWWDQSSSCLFLLSVDLTIEWSRRPE